MAGAVATFGVISATSHLVGLSVSQARAPPSAGHNLPCCGPHPWVVHKPTHSADGVAWGSIHGIVWGRSDSLMTTINPTEADFLTHCIEVWCNGEEGRTFRFAGRPVMFTTQEGGYERVLLTYDQIESLFMRIQSLKSK